MIPGEEQGSGLDHAVPFALAWALGVSVVAVSLYMLTLGWEYYWLPIAEQGAHPSDSLLRSSGEYGLALGVAAAALMGLNVLYLVRRNLPDSLPLLGSPRAWMTIHVATGLAMPVVALLHSGFTFRTPLGVSALGLVATAALAGIMGRYLYSVVPRGTSGRELRIEQVHGATGKAMDRLQSQLSSDPQAEAAIRSLLDEPVLGRQGGWIGLRVMSLAWSDFSQRRRVRKLRRRLGKGAEVRRLLSLLEAVLRLRLQSKQHQELNLLMASWRGAHRWLALTATLLLLGHVYVAVSYAQLW